MFLRRWIHPRPLEIQRRALRDLDVQIEILYCGVCHSDLHQARNEWRNSVYPVVPGHEILGRVTRVGAKVTKFKAGDLAAVGCMVDSCRTCAHCAKGMEQFCMTGATFTYDGTTHTGGSALVSGAGLVTGNYAIPVASLRALSVFTNTVPTQAYRSSGRPELR